MNYQNWKAANDALNLIGKNVLIVGGTQGIGAGLAIRFSQLGSSVVIAGRNEALANEVISQMKTNKKSETQEFKFIKVDVTLIDQLKKFTTETTQYFEKRGGVDHIIQTQGGLNAALQLTTEGHDKAFMLNSYSKWYITNKLMPLLKSSSIYVCNPATRGSIDFNDVEMLNSWRLLGGPGNRDGVFLDSMTKEFQERYPTRRFYHIFPGFVDTKVLENSNLNPVINAFAKLIQPIAVYFARNITTFADLPIYYATQGKEGGVSMNENAKLYTPYEWIKNPENRAKLWAWNENLEKQHSK